MPRRQQSLAESLIRSPWWVSILVGCFLFGALRWVMPALLADSPTGRALGPALTILSPWVLVFFGMLAVLSFLFGRKRKAIVERQSSIGTLKALSWKDFEYMVAEAFRRRGYQVDYSLSSGADGGIDVLLSKNDSKTAVQCKRWKTYKVGAPVVRELLGAMAANGLPRGMVITSGSFTADAKAFAAGKPIQLIDGRALLDLVRGAQTRTTTRPSPPPMPAPRVSPPPVPPPECPLCGSRMVERTARRGTNAGTKFWGCPTYPKCRGVRDRGPKSWSER